MEPAANLALSLAFFGVLAGLFVYLKKHGGTTIPSAAASSGHGNVKVLSSDSQFDRELSSSKTPILVDFTATWCGPCQRIAPYFTQLSAQYSDITFLKVDVDQLKGTAQRCGVSSMPTFQVFVNGRKVDEMSGANPNGLKALCDKYSRGR